MQLLLATRKQVKPKAFLREEGGPLAVEGVCENLSFYLASLHLLDSHFAISLSRLRRQLPPGGSL